MSFVSSNQGRYYLLPQSIKYLINFSNSRFLLINSETELLDYFDRRHVYDCHKNGHSLYALYDVCVTLCNVVKFIISFLLICMAFILDNMTY